MVRAEILLYFFHCLPSILCYNQMVDRDENDFSPFIVSSSIYCILNGNVLYHLFLFFPFVFLKVQLCHFSNNSKLSISIFIMFAFCMFVTANLVMTYFSKDRTYNKHQVNVYILLHINIHTFHFQFFLICKFDKWAFHNQCRNY